MVGAFRIAVRLLIVEDSELIRKMASLAKPRARARRYSAAQACYTESGREGVELIDS